MHRQRIDQLVTKEDCGYGFALDLFKRAPLDAPGEVGQPLALSPTHRGTLFDDDIARLIK